MKDFLLPRIDLTPEQNRIVEMEPGEHRVVFGPPGSGKTQCLVHRAEHLSSLYRVPPDGYRVFVFTNVLKDYLKAGLETLRLPVECVTTFDHWCRETYQEKVNRTLPWRDGGPDFDKMRKGVLEFYKKEPRVRNNFHFALVDEGQDLTTEAFEILKLAARHVTVFADHKQQIFEGGASEEEILSRLGLRRRNATLLNGYRNSTDVARFAAYFIAEPTLRAEYVAQVEAQRRAGERPLLFLAEGTDQEMDRLAEIVRQRRMLNERVGIIVGLNRHVHGFAKGLKERGVEVFKAVAPNHNAAGNGGRAEVNTPTDSLAPVIATYYMAKGLTFDSVLLPRLHNASFPFAEAEQRQRLLFVGISRATKWVYLSAVQGREIEEVSIMQQAVSNSHLSLQVGTEMPFSVGTATVVSDEDDDWSVL